VANPIQSFMSKFLPAALLLLLLGVPAVAQSETYSIDNFDIRNGVRVHETQPKTDVAQPRVGRTKKTSLPKKVQAASAANETLANMSSSSLVKPAVLISDSGANLSIGSLSSLRGYTTGSVQVDGYLIEAGTSNGVDPLLLYSVMHQESSFKLRAISPKGARGLMQLMPGTAIRYGVTNIFDPKQNIEGGARYLRFLLDHFDGDLNLALAGYNAGEGAVEKYGWRIPPYSETQEYVRRISRRYSLLQDPSAAMYARTLSRAQVARLQAKPSSPLAIYERTVSTVRLPDGRLQLMSQ
jgi:soluble lytic murein transglycosylase-like protein